MEFEVIDYEPDMLTIELDNEECYRCREKVTVLLNDETVGEYESNVIVIESLEPDTEYKISVIDSSGSRCDHIERTLKQTVVLNVRKFGAAGDGEHKDTAFIQAAIDCCPVDGTVLIPEGTYLCGPIFLKSDLRIKLDKGAVILGIPDRSEYPILPGMTLCSNEKDEYNLGTWEGNPLSCFASLITGIDVNNVDIYGQGVIDGNAGNADWWIDAKKKRIAWRPRLVFLCRCEGVCMNGITLRNSPSWTIHPYYSKDIALVRLTIRNPDDSPNTDGIDPESCKNVIIAGTDISVGDDCIAIKSGKYYMAQRHYMETDGVIVRNCYLNHGHGSVTIGSECAGGVKNVHVSRCIFNETDRGLRIKTRRGRGSRSVISGIVFEKIIMNSVRMPFTINMFYYCDPDGHSEYCQSKEALPVDELTPLIDRISAVNISCRGAEVSGLAAYGLSEQKIGFIGLENVEIGFRPVNERKPSVPLMMDGLSEMSGKGIFVRNTDRLSLKNVTVTGSADTAIDSDDQVDIHTENVSFS